MQVSNNSIVCRFQVIGEPCGFLSPYTFYKGIRISPITQEENASRNNNCIEAIDRKTAELLRSNDTIIRTIKNDYDSDSSDILSELPLPLKTHTSVAKPKLEGW